MNELAPDILSPSTPGSRATAHQGGIKAAAYEGLGHQGLVTQDLVDFHVGYARDFWLDEGIPVAKWLEADGTCDALKMTGGSSLLNPMYLFKGDAPIADFAAVMPQPIKMGVRLIGRRFIREYPYRDASLLEDARQICAAVDMPMILLGVITDRAARDPVMAEGFGYVAMARALLREPDLVNRIAKDSSTPSLGIPCNKCNPTNSTGIRCVLVNRETTRGSTWKCGLFLWKSRFQGRNG